MDISTLIQLIPDAAVVDDGELVVRGQPLLVQLAAPGPETIKNISTSPDQKYLSEINYYLQDWQRESRRGAHNLPSREEKYWRLLCSLK